MVAELEPGVPIELYLESGNRRVFAGALDWPGWCRAGRDRDSALEALLQYGPRYAAVVHDAGLPFSPPVVRDRLLVREQLTGNATTDFGAPNTVPECDTRKTLTAAEKQRYVALLQAAWRRFDRAVEQAEGKTLNTGPRGGGRDLEKIVRHVLESDGAYLSQLAVRHNLAPELPLAEMLAERRRAIVQMLSRAQQGELPDSRPRGGAVWTPHIFIRRVLWHLLDHLWEIEDRAGN